MTEEQTIEQMEMELIAEECRITTDEIVEYPPTALSLGEKVVGNIYDPLKDYIVQKPKHIEIPF
jgi:hypothetical protein